MNPLLQILSFPDGMLPQQTPVFFVYKCKYFQTHFFCRCLLQQFSGSPCIRIYVQKFYRSGVFRHLFFQIFYFIILQRIFMFFPVLQIFILIPQSKGGTENIFIVHTIFQFFFCQSILKQYGICQLKSDFTDRQILFHFLIIQIIFCHRIEQNQLFHDVSAALYGLVILLFLLIFKNCLCHG